MFKKQIFIPVLVYVIFTLAVVDSASIFAVFPQKSGEFTRCYNQGEAGERCIKIKSVSPVTSPCTNEKKENAVYYLADNKIEVGVLNADNTITNSQCDFSELTTIHDKFSIPKQALGIRLRDFIDDKVDAVYLFVIGTLASILGFVKYLGCQITKAYNLPCFKKPKKPSSDSNPHFNSGNNPSSGHNPTSGYNQSSSLNQMYQQQYRPQHMEASSASDISSLAGHSFLRSTLSSDQFHRYASAPDIRAQEESRQNKRNHSLLDLPDYQQDFQDNSRITVQPRQKQQRLSNPFNSTRMDTINESNSEEAQNISRAKGCMCQKGDCKDNGNNCSCKRVLKTCTAACHPNRQCRNYD